MRLQSRTDPRLDPPAAALTAARTVVLKAALGAALACAAVGLAAATELNTANQAELEQVKGVGPQLSEQLLHERARGGAFTGWDDLVRRLKGVGPARAARLSEAGLRVAGRAYPGKSPVPVRAGPASSTGAASPAAGAWPADAASAAPASLAPRPPSR